MKIGYWHGYRDGIEEGRTQCQNEFERVLAILREELVDARLEGSNQTARADAACDLLLGHLGTRAISLAGKQEEVKRVERQVNNMERLANIPDPTDDLPIGHPNGRFKTLAEASLFDEDVATEQG